MGRRRTRDRPPQPELHRFCVRLDPWRFDAVPLAVTVYEISLWLHITRCRGRPRRDLCRPRCSSRSRWGWTPATCRSCTGSRSSINRYMAGPGAADHPADRHLPGDRRQLGLRGVLDQRFVPDRLRRSVDCRAATSSRPTESSRRWSAARSPPPATGPVELSDEYLAKLATEGHPRRPGRFARGHRRLPDGRSSPAPEPGPLDGLLGDPGRRGGGRRDRCACFWLVSLAVRDASIVDIAWGLLFVTDRLGRTRVGEGSGDAAGRRCSPRPGDCGSRFTSAAETSVTARTAATVRCEPAVRSGSGSGRCSASSFSRACSRWSSRCRSSRWRRSAGTRSGSLSWVGVAVFAVGLAFETIGDAQLDAFKRDPASGDQVMDRGLWRYTRHPNYFGDAVVWWGLWLVAVGVRRGLVDRDRPGPDDLPAAQGLRRGDARSRHRRPPPGLRRRTSAGPAHSCRCRQGSARASAPRRRGVWHARGPDHGL